MLEKMHAASKYVKGTRLGPNLLASTRSIHLQRLGVSPARNTSWVHGRIMQAAFAAAVEISTAPAPAAASEAHAAEGGYGANSIQVLEGLEPVRKRPGMYIGSTGPRGLHHLLWEVIDNSIDEVQAGHASLIYVDVDLKSGWVSVDDNGRGIPTDIHPRTGKSSLETVLTVLHAGGKFGGDASGYSVSGGLHGVGISVVNALSQNLEVTVWRGGIEYKQQFSCGVVLGTMLERPDLSAPAAGNGSNGAIGASVARRGTRVRYRFDQDVFAEGVVLDPETIRNRLRELAFLNSAVKIMFRAHKSGSVPLFEEVSGAIGHGISNLPGREIPTVAEGSSRGSSSSERESASDSAGGSSSGGGEAATDKKKKSSKKGTKSEAEGGDEDDEARRQSGANASSSAGVESALDWQVFSYKGGLQEYVEWLNRGKLSLHDPMFFTRKVEGMQIEVALQWCSDVFYDTTIGFANSIRTGDGGTHMEGMRAGITRCINTLAKKQKLLKEGEPALSGEHIREGLGAVVSVKVPNPEFEGQTKTRLGNPEVKRVVEAAVLQHLTEHLETHPAVLSLILAKALQAARAAEAAKKARELVRRKNVLTKSTLPGKLADCSSDKRGDTEIFVVEGDSAGGSAKQARDRHFQAVLPLRGKILNVERSDDASMYKNNEISNLIVALGLGTKGSDGVDDSLRYGKLIILTDADVDGAHIRTLLLTFLFRYRRSLFEKGHVYVAVPPLYKLEISGGSGRPSRLEWCYNEEDLTRKKKLLAPGSFTLQRFKGLGEMMPQQLWDTTLNPATRVLRRLTVDDATAASHMFTLLMGDQVAPRKALIEEHGSKLAMADLDL